LNEECYWDGGDCGCAFDYTDSGAADCDVAWDEFGLTCADLADTYGWNCGGCTCPGDVDGHETDSGCTC